MSVEEYEFYKKQLRRAKTNNANSLSVSIEFLESILDDPEELTTVKQAYESLQKAK